MADQVTSPELADKLNDPPVIYKGCTGGEIISGLMASFVITMIVSVFAYFFLGGFVLIGSLPVFLAVFRVVANKLSVLREIKPQGYLQIKAAVMVARISKSPQVICVSQRYRRGRGL